MIQHPYLTEWVVKYLCIKVKPTRYYNVLAYDQSRVLLTHDDKEVPGNVINMNMNTIINIDININTNINIIDMYQ